MHCVEFQPYEVVPVRGPILSLHSSQERPHLVSGEILTAEKLCHDILASVVEDA